MNAYTVSAEVTRPTTDEERNQYLINTGTVAHDAPSTVNEGLTEIIIAHSMEEAMEVFASVPGRMGITFHAINAANVAVRIQGDPV